jgi:hypothetical protein
VHRDPAAACAHCGAEVAATHSTRLARVERPSLITFPFRARVRNTLRPTALRDAIVWRRHLGLSDQDVMLAAFPKSGSTWLTFMLAELLWQAGGEQTLLDNRFLPEVGKQNQAEHRLPAGGRLIRTHERWRSEYRRAIYVVRDGRDVAVSLYYHLQRSQGMRADFTDYLTAFFEGWLIGAGPWDRHVTGWLDSPAASTGGVLLVRYEDLQADALGQLRRTAEFLGVAANDEQLAAALAAGSKDAMQGREKATTGIAHREAGATIPVVRKGVVGDWQNHFSPADLERFDQRAGYAMQRLGYRLNSDH